jgi:hypothetical protein
MSSERIKRKQKRRFFFPSSFFCISPLFFSSITISDYSLSSIFLVQFTKSKPVRTKNMLGIGLFIVTICDVIPSQIYFFFFSLSLLNFSTLSSIIHCFSISPLLIIIYYLQKNIKNSELIIILHW